MTDNEFNKRADKARLSAGWSHDRRYYNFMREHDGRGRFVESRCATGFASAVVGVVALALFIGLLLLIGAY